MATSMQHLGHRRFPRWRSVSLKFARFWKAIEVFSIENVQYWHTRMCVVHTTWQSQPCCAEFVSIHSQYVYEMFANRSWCQSMYQFQMASASRFLFKLLVADRFVLWIAQLVVGTQLQQRFCWRHKVLCCNGEAKVSQPKSTISSTICTFSLDPSSYRWFTLLQNMALARTRKHQSATCSCFARNCASLNRINNESSTIGVLACWLTL